MRSILKGKRDGHGSAHALPDMQGRRMRRQKLLCLKSLGACSALWAAGCGTHDSPALSGPDAIPAPRRIELPANIRPLLQVEAVERSEVDGGFVPAQYQQPQPPASSQPRITGLNAAPPSSAPAGTVRESYWGNPRAAATSSATMPRGDYVPVVPPRATAAPAVALSSSANSFGAPPPPAPLPPGPAQSPLPPSAQPTAAPPRPVSGPELSAPNFAVQAPISTSAAAPPQQSAFVPASEPTNSYAPAPPAQQMAYIPQQSAVNQFQPSLASSPSPQAPPQQTAAMLPVVQQAQQMSNQAAMMAQRGMFYSAKTELIKALTLISQSLDVQQGTAAHTNALTAGLTALEEARDFAASGQKGGGTTVAAIAATHQTKLQTPIAPGTSPVIAQQQDFGFAQDQLMIAAGGLPASSDILYRLGRLQTALAAHDNDATTLHGPQAIVFHQAALATDANNWLAANELGVLYVRYGQLPQARQLLVQSVMIHPHRQGWQNLAVVHRRLGENDLAQRAEAEIQLLDKQQQGQPADPNGMVRWVDTKTFAASGGGDANWPATVAAKPAATAGGPTRR